jgi:hypothetical protein
MGAFLSAVVESEYATSREVACSRPDSLKDFCFNLLNGSSHKVPLGFSQLLTEIFARSRKVMLLKSKARRLLMADNSPPSLSRLSKQCEIRNISQLCRPPRPGTRTNSVPLSPQANYTDWATATWRRNLMPTVADRGVSRGQRGGSPRSLISVF